MNLSVPVYALSLVLFGAVLTSPINVGADPKLEHEEITVDFALDPSETQEDQLILSTAPTSLESGLYKVQVRVFANVCKRDGVSPVVLNVLHHQRGTIVSNDAIEPSVDGKCEEGELQFEFRPWSSSLTELNVYARRKLELSHTPKLGPARILYRTNQRLVSDDRSADTEVGADEVGRQTHFDEAYLAQASPYLSFMREYLWQPIGGGSLADLRAFAETEKPLGDGDNVWFWTDDNAKGLEAYLTPKAYAQYQDVAESLLEFVLRMSDGPMILRRFARPTVKVVSGDPEHFRVNTGLMNYHGNLHSGEVALSYRFHDGRDVDALKLTGNWIRFDINGRTYKFDMEDSIISARVEERDGQVLLTHVSQFSVSEAPVARVTYSYTIDPALTLLRRDISVEALSGDALDNVQVSSAMDQLSNLPQGIAYHRFCRTRADALSCLDVTGENRIELDRGPLDWFSLIQLGNFGFSYAVHIQPSRPEQLVEVVQEAGERKDRFHHVYALYQVGEVTQPHIGRVSEFTLLTSGGLYQSMDTYGELLKNARFGTGIDLSASYDYGAELNALACYYMFARAGHYVPLRNPADSEVLRLKDWFDEHLSMFERNFLTEQDDVENPFPYMFGRGVAFALLGADCMYRATGQSEYLKRIRRMVDIILRSQRGKEGPEYAGNFRCNGADSYLDCQGALILALSRAALLVDDPRIQPAVVAGINAIKMNRWQGVEGRSTVIRGDGEVFMKVSPARPDERDGMLWGFKAGLLLRGLKAAELADSRGRLVLDQHTRWHTRELIILATDYIHTSTVPRGELLEILTSYRSGETNSESQPWMTLGLFPIDSIIATIEPPSASAP